MGFIFSMLFALFVTFAQYLIGFIIITYLIDGVFTLADILIIAWIAAQIIYGYFKVYKETNKEE